MFFSVSNNETQRTLDISPDSVTIIVKDIVQDLTISSLELPIAAFNTLIDQRQQFLENQLARLPISPNQQGTWEMQDEVRASVGDHDVSQSSFPVTWMTFSSIRRIRTLTWMQCIDQALILPSLRHCLKTFLLLEAQTTP